MGKQPSVWTPGLLHVALFSLGSTGGRAAADGEPSKKEQGRHSATLIAPPGLEPGLSRSRGAAV